jgi:hypothetical protein
MLKGIFTEQNTRKMAKWMETDNNDDGWPDECFGWKVDDRDSGVSKLL